MLPRERAEGCTQGTKGLTHLSSFVSMVSSFADKKTHEKVNADTHTILEAYAFGSSRINPRVEITAA